MAAILRVKRKNTGIPLDTLVIACKRPKTEASLSDTPTVQTVAQFAGTLTDPTEDVTKHVAKILPKINAENHKVGIKRVSDDDYPANISCKIPKIINEDSVIERYKVTDCQHSLDISNEEEFRNKWMTLIDVEDCSSSSRLAKQAKEEDIEDFVYDLYYAQTNTDIWVESMVDDIVVRRLEVNFSDEDFEDEDDSSDSNAESHWKNDYPDTDPDLSSRFNDSDDSDDSDHDSDDSDHDSSLFKNDFYRRIKHGFEFNSHDSILLDNENSSSSSKEMSDDEVKLASDEQISDNEDLSDNEGMENI